eukprot:scaffold358_cov95-Skeletonema_dohrnii-CCMP3373.AAC.1
MSPAKRKNRKLSEGPGLMRIKARCRFSEGKWPLTSESERAGSKSKREKKEDWCFYIPRRNSY